jgi:hypothetical protein
MLNANILKRVNALVERGSRRDGGKFISLRPEAEPILNECIDIIEAIQEPGEVQEALYYKTVGECLVLEPAQPEINMIVAHRMLGELQNTEYLHDSIRYMKRHITPDSL